ncbi:MAG: hypothetical protein ACLPWD_10670 [Methanobacterium sp.]
MVALRVTECSSCGKKNIFTVYQGIGEEERWICSNIDCKREN